MKAEIRRICVRTAAPTPSTASGIQKVLQDHRNTRQMNESTFPRDHKMPVQSRSTLHCEFSKEQQRNQMPFKLLCPGSVGIRSRFLVATTAAPCHKGHAPLLDRLAAYPVLRPHPPPVRPFIGPSVTASRGGGGAGCRLEPPVAQVDVPPTARC